MKRVVFQDVDARDGLEINVPGGNVRKEFIVANEAYSIYQDSLRRFFPSDNPMGDSAANTDRKIKIRWPGITAGTAFTNPAPGQPAPVIVLSRNDFIDPVTGNIRINDVRDAAGNLIGAGLRPILTSELAHAVHFCQFGKARRRELKLRYLANLVAETAQDIAAGRGAGWRFNVFANRVRNRFGINSIEFTALRAAAAAAAHNIAI